MGLNTKLSIAVSILLLVVMVPYYYLNVETIRTLLTEEAVAAADKINETIIKTTYHKMLEDDRESVYGMIQEAGTQEGVEQIRIITPEGDIRFSTDAGEIGTHLEKNATSCGSCHQASEVRSSSPNGRIGVCETEHGSQVLGVSRAIYNEPNCSRAACHFHPEHQVVLGALHTTISLDRVNQQTAQYAKGFVLVTVTMLFAIAIFLRTIIHRMVNRPLKEILQHTRRVGELRFDSRVDLPHDDELGELANYLNEMTAQLKTAQHQLAGLAENLEVKVEERTRELKQMQAQLIRSEKLASLGEIVAGIAHELNNPLTGILVLSSLIQKKTDLDPTLQEDLATVVHESKRCARIVKGLLDFSRVGTPQKSLADVNRIMDSTLAIIGTQSIFHDVVFDKRYAPDLPPVMVDANQIEQVFINVLLNAGQAMSSGGRLTLTTRAAGAEVCVGIADTGCGIPKEHVGRIFDPFFSTKESKGTGLGLSVSYGIVENHGGRIEVESQPGVGTAFTIHLPVAGARGGERPAAA
jgi:two-component system NtrC family sensor kinase